MRRQGLMLAERLAATLDRQAAPGLALQVYDGIRRLVLDGTLAAGQRLPASRALAADLALGRNTVIEAYDRLAAEGLIDGRVGAGSFVAAGARPRPVPPDAADGPGPNGAARLSSRAEAVLGEAGILQGGAFASCVPELSLFPFATWQRLVSDGWRNARLRDTQYAAAGGDPALREAVADYLHLARQVRCSAAQVVIVNGAQQGLDLCARFLAEPGDRAWVEDPGYPGARRAFRAAALALVPVPVDDEGMAPTDAMWSAPPRLIYVTPSHQYPMGMVMSLKRRRELVRQAQRHGSWILEDDYDGEFRLEGRPVPALQSLDGGQRVIYVGTFGKVLFPGLRLGYLVLPPSIAERFSRALARLHFDGRQVTQAALARFFEQGHFALHIRRMRELYRERRRLLESVWHAELGSAAPLVGTGSGLHVVARLPERRDAPIAALAAEQGIVAQSVASLALGPAPPSGLVLGYGAVHEKDIRRHGAALARLVAGQLR